MRKAYRDITRYLKEGAWLFCTTLAIGGAEPVEVTIRRHHPHAHHVEHHHRRPSKTVGPT